MLYEVITGKVLTGITLYEKTYKSGLVGSTYTDENGFFRFDHVPEGDIEVRAFRQETYEQAAVKAILDGEKNLTLVLPGSGGTVQGYVRDASGTYPVEGATVVAGPSQVKTDDKGFFRISGLPLGRFTVSAQA